MLNRLRLENFKAWREADLAFGKVTGFFPSDRKFLAVAVAGRAVVLNAMDSDWGEHKALMDELGVEVDELCPQRVARRA